ncbi:MAG: DUF6282 family protein [Clostridiales Family XIII bacterium]|jgi:hypothetical protein|nr:DUF6282 family protein [Clostridiales Family XIII bacterium]
MEKPLLNEIITRDLLRGMIDLHVHAGPSVAVRKLDAIDMTEAANALEYSAFVVKDHYYPTMMSAELCNNHIAGKRVKVFGGIALNNSVGGINIKTVDCAYSMGAKFVYMPTVSSKQHIDTHKGHAFPGASSRECVEENPIYYLDEDGALERSVIEVIDYVSQRDDLVLATGHSSLEEADALIKKAHELGVKNIYANHPFYMIGADISKMREWADLGAYIEINACVFLFGETPTPMETAKLIFDEIPLDRIVIASDLGQKNNCMPIKGMEVFVTALMNHYNISQEQIHHATKINPARILDLY